MNEAIIETRGLTRRYRGGQSPFALQALDLSVSRGEIFGYLGPNGAGKTTTIKLLLDLIRPASGSISIFGLDVRRDSVAIRKRTGYLPGELILWNGQTGAQVIRYFLALRGHTDHRYADELIQRLEFDPTKKIRSYSTGNRRKLGLILALMHQPDLLILDEPTNGLDPLVQQTFMELMREARTAGQTVFLSSHMLSEVQAICDNVGILRDGRLLATRHIDDIRNAGFSWVTFRLREPLSPEAAAALPGVQEVTQHGSELRLRLTGDFDPVLRALGQSYIEHIQVQEPSLEDVFLAYFGDGPSAAAPAEVA